MSAGIPNGSHRSGALSVEAITRQIRLHSGWRRQLAAIGTKNISARPATVRRSNQIRISFTRCSALPIACGGESFPKWCIGTEQAAVLLSRLSGGRKSHGAALAICESHSLIEWSYYLSLFDSFGMKGHLLIALRVGETSFARSRF
jgi:hypothetical protein